MSITLNDPQDDPTYFNFSEFCNDADFCNDLSDFDPVPKGDGIADFAGRLSTAPSTPLSSERRDNMGSMSHSPSIVPSPGYSNGPSDSAVIVPKIGSRFSKAVIRMLKDWLACHTDFPYPTEPELAALQSETGLNKTQITNWFANARRRGLVQSARPTPFQAKDSPTNPMDIPPRPGTPAPRGSSSLAEPLARWVDSPPEDEPATAGAIARALVSTSGSLFYKSSPRDSWQSSHGPSSASSVGTSDSSEAWHSSGSHQSLRASRISPKRRSRRRRRPTKVSNPTTKCQLSYQCTFCTEAFKTKYDWQRHEKSLHLPVERWVCSLHGPRNFKQDTTVPYCVFCGQGEPDDGHIETHNYSLCQIRDIEERTFFRKDHLIQHLRLFHNAEVTHPSIDEWRRPVLDVRSRCGFCGLVMNTWQARVDHLAEHFKLGKTMADWKGEWGFDAAILKNVERAIPPSDLIDYEKTTPNPFAASDPPLSSPANAYELLKLEIDYYIECFLDRNGKLPSNDEIQLEACRVILAAESGSAYGANTNPTTISNSWLRDLIMSSHDVTQRAKFGPIRLCREGRLPTLQLKGKDSLFGQCPFEAQLQAFISIQEMRGTQLKPERIQEEACDIVRHMERTSVARSDIFANWMIALIYTDLDWVTKLQKRTPSFHASMMGVGNPPTSLASAESPFSGALPLLQMHNFQSRSALVAATECSTDSLLEGAASTNYGKPSLHQRYCAGDLDCNHWFDRDITRWVGSTMSLNNPSYHIPSDEEIQHQARWIMYDCDDTWNQTPADNPEWLWRFKRSVGIPIDPNVMEPFTSLQDLAID
ncbi:hypothetical protein NW763_014268 [Fusarium oxysporum]|nr:hypothetical protein NW763_014268 [Fusarium oxysporum]